MLAVARVPLPVIPPADCVDVWLDQFFSLLDHYVANRACGCPDCVRFLRVSFELNKPWGEPALFTTPMRKHAGAV